MLEKGADVTKGCSAPILEAAANGHTQVKGVWKISLYVFSEAFQSFLCSINGIRNIMEDLYALKPAVWQTPLFCLQKVKKSDFRL